MTVKINEKNMKQGLLGLVIALVEIIKDVLERQAVRRMESGRLNEEEIERLGNALMDVGEALEMIKRENGLEETIDSVRSSLDELAQKIVDVETWERELRMKV